MGEYPLEVALDLGNNLGREEAPADPVRLTSSPESGKEIIWGMKPC